MGHRGRDWLFAVCGDPRFILSIAKSRSIEIRATSPESPPIMETIFSKIDAAAVFLADLTYVAERIGGKKASNPHVCIAHGYALGALGWRRVIAVMNTAFGDPKAHELSFDLRYAR